MAWLWVLVAFATALITVIVVANIVNASSTKDALILIFTDACASGLVFILVARSGRGAGPAFASARDGKAPNLAIMALIVGLTSLYALVVSLSYTRFNGGLFGAYEAASLAAWICVFVTLSCLAPIAEEMFFRGWMWSNLEQTGGRSVAAIATAIMWCLIHFDKVKIAILMPVAVLLSVARSLSGAYALPILCHSLYNSVQLLTIWLVVRAAH